MINPQTLELTLEDCRTVDTFLEDYKRNPSNANKYRIGLHAWIEEWAKQAILAAVERAETEVVELSTGSDEEYSKGWRTGAMAMGNVLKSELEPEAT